MEIRCRRCGGSIPATDVNVDRLLAKCVVCNTLFDIGEQVPRAPTQERARREKSQFHIPPGIGIEEWGNDFRIRRRWFRWHFLFLVFFCTFWDGFLVFWYSMGFSFADQMGPLSLVMLLFPVIHVAVGVGLTYYTLCGFVNRTELSVSSGQFQVRHLPLPWPGNRTLFVDELDQLYCQRSIRRGRHGNAWTVYDLNALTKDGKKVKLVGGLDSPELALYLESEVERRLGIADRPVAGEYRG